MATKNVVPDKTSMLRAFDLLQEYNESVINDLEKRFPQSDWRIIDSFTARRCINIHRMFNTLRSLLIPNYDDCSINALLRSLADHIASLLLIYSGSTKDEILLRHLLCIADGITERKETLLSFCRVNNHIDVSEQEHVLNECEEYIRLCPLYPEHKNRIERLLTKHNWKYKSLASGESYKWSELYRDILKLNNDYVEYLSQYVHGLAGSVLSSNKNDVSRATAICIACYLNMKFSLFIWDICQIRPPDVLTNTLNELIR